MRLVEDFALTEWERQHAWPPEQAVERVREALLHRQSLDGLEQLRAGLMIDLDSEVLEQVERAECAWSGRKRTTWHGQCPIVPSIQRCWRSLRNPSPHARHSCFAWSRA